MNINKYPTISTLIILVILPFFLIGQRTNNKTGLSKQDSIYANSLPVLEAPINYSNKVSLPWELDNSIYPFLRPAFTQQSFWNCGQSAGVGYNFTYEMNVARLANGEIPENQYSPNFTYNFMNHGYGWGVSYFNSFEAIKMCGNPNLADYGGLFNIGGLGWKSGYQLYENAMRNRITDVYAIDVSTPQGVETLKYWLLDHLDGSQYGGVANFYFGFHWSGSLPPESPDTGWPIIIESSPDATHALTIIGYNDSVRFDVNGDGQFTNHIDINHDQKVDMKDWEIGAFKYINSTLNNDGRGYIMYRTLAHESGYGGIWNQQVHVLKVDAEYEPIANIRLKLNHNSREKIKIITGVSTDLDDNYPQFTMEYPIFHYQGGDHYMQGNDTLLSNKDMELALDISPLFSYLSDGQEAKFFVQIAENDKKSFGEGQVLYYSLITGSDISNETICEEVPIDIKDNAVTTLQLNYSPDFDKVHITTEELPVVEAGIIQDIIIEAEGGYPPYDWSILNNYRLREIPNEFEAINQTKLEFENNYEGYSTVELPFDFPFYGDTINKISVFVDGFIMFDEVPYPYPYFVGEESIITTNKMIAPFISSLVFEEGTDEGVWIESNSDNIIIRWMASCATAWGANDVNFSLTLYKDGNIDTHFGAMKFPADAHWASGVSYGDNANYTLLNKNQDHEEVIYSSFSYTKPTYIPDQQTISNSGKLSILIENPTIQYPVTIQVKDRRGVVDKVSYELSSSELDISYKMDTEKGFIDYDESTAISIDIKNNSANSYENVSIQLKSTDEYLSIDNKIIEIGNIDPGQLIHINDAATFEFLHHVPDRFNSIIECKLISDTETISTSIDVTVNAPQFRLLSKEIIDGNDGVLYPGETAQIKMSIQNTGHARSSGGHAVLGSEYDKIYIKWEKAEINELNPGDTISFYYTIAAKFAVPLGKLTELDLDIYVDNMVFDRVSTNIRLGHIPVLIIDMDPGQESGIYIHNLLNEFGLQNTLTSSLDVNLDDYLSAFVCLGGLFNLYTLTEKESQQLVDFLGSSRNLYMEGRSTWSNSQFLPIVHMFNIRAEQPSYYYPLDTIIGVSDLYTKDMMFTIDDNNPYINYFLHPEEGAITLLKTLSHDSAGVSIAYDEGNYKTVGSNIQFSTLVDTDLIGTKKNYLLGILEFFDIKKYMYVDVPENALGGNYIGLEIFPNPTSGSINIQINNTLNSTSSLEIFNIQGKLVYHRNINETISTNRFTTNWSCQDQNGEILGPGIYFVVCTSSGHITTKKLIIK